MIRFFHCFTLAALCFIPVSVRANEDTPRAAAMRKILSDPELAKLADREIARRTGLAPTTVGNWRRRLVTLL